MSEDLLAVERPTSPLEQHGSEQNQLTNLWGQILKKGQCWRCQKSKTKGRNGKVLHGTSWSIGIFFSWKCLHFTYGRFVDLARQHALLVEWELFQLAKQQDIWKATSDDACRLVSNVCFFSFAFECNGQAWCTAPSLLWIKYAADILIVWRSNPVKLMLFPSCRFIGCKLVSECMTCCDDS